MTERIYYVRRRIYHRSKAPDPRGDDHLTKYRTRHFQFRYLVFPGRRHSITPESYDTMSIYIGAAGTGTFLIGEQPETMDLHLDEILLVPEKNSLRRQNRRGLYLYRNYYKKENTMNDLVKAKEVLNLKKLISYEEEVLQTWISYTTIQ